jgi:hypothetical protein
VRVFLLILIALIVGSAAGSMSSWFLLREPQPLATAAGNTAIPASNAALLATVNDEEREAREAIQREADARTKTEGQGGVLAQQARQTESLREQVEDAPPVTAPATVEPPSVDRATNRAAVGRPPVTATKAAAPVEPGKDGPNYVLPIGIGVIAAIVAFLVANRVVSQDI